MASTLKKPPQDTLGLQCGSSFNTCISLIVINSGPLAAPHDAHIAGRTIVCGRGKRCTSATNRGADPEHLNDNCMWRKSCLGEWWQLCLLKGQISSYCIIF